MTAGGGDAGAKAGLSWRKQVWERRQRRPRRREQSHCQLGFILSKELKGEPGTRTESCQADEKTLLWELEMASGFVFTSGGSITHGIFRDRPVGSRSTADPDGSVTQAYFPTPRTGLHWWQLGGARHLS